MLSQLLFSQNDSLVEYGKKLVSKSELSEGIAFYTKQIAETKNTEQKIHFLLGLAQIYKLKSNFDESYKCYEKALLEINKIKSRELEFLYHIKLLEFYRSRGLYIDAIKHENKAASILKNTTISDIYLAKYYNRKAAIFTEYYLTQDSIVKYAQKSLEIAEKIDDKDNVFYSKLELASVYEREKDYKKSISYFIELIEYSKQNNMVQHQSDAYVSYIMSLLRDNQKVKCLEVALEALEFAKEHNLLIKQLNYASTIQGLYEENKNFEKANEYSKLILELQNDYNLIIQDKFLLDLKEKYKLAEKENQIKINTLEIKNKNKELASNKIDLYVSLALFLFAIVVALLIAYFLKKTRQSNRQLQSLSQENEFLLSEANHRINNNLQLVVILISDQLKKSSTDNTFQLKSILTKVDAISTLHKHLYKNKDKQKVDIHDYLNDVKISFFDVFKENNIKTNFHVDAVEIPSDHAMYFGLLLTELCINSIKHAFEKQELKAINFELLHSDELLYFKYSDNGHAKINHSIKPKLIDKICRQLKIIYTINTENGFAFSFEKEMDND